MRIRNLPVLAVCFSTALALGQPPERPRPPVVRATAEGVATARPDRAVIDIGVVTQAATAQAAGAQNARQTTEVISQMKKALPAGTQIQTAGYSLYPNYRQGPGPSRQITGYTASNVVKLTIDDLDGVSKAIDTATGVGANMIQGLQFTIKDEQSLRGVALRMATRNARANAEAIASALGAKIVRVVEVAEGNPQEIRPMMRAMAMNAAVTTPVEAGTVDIHATVTLTAEIAP